MSRARLAAIGIAGAGVLAGCGSERDDAPRAVLAQSMDYQPPFLVNDDPWTPSERQLTRALDAVEVAFDAAASRQGVTARFDTYRVLYGGLRAKTAPIIRMQGQCPRIPDDITVTGGGGTCIFGADYDVEQKTVVSFGFGGPY